MLLAKNGRRCLKDVTMEIYEFKKEDAYNFARHVGIRCFERNGELHFQKCPMCKATTNDKKTFAINLQTGQFKCLRQSCGYHGNMITLSRDFDFSLGNIVDEYLQPKRKFKNFKTPDKPIEPKPPAIEYLLSRGISERVAKKYQITTQTKFDNVLVFPFYNENGKMEFIKYRKTDFDKTKDNNKEWCEANGKPILFGMYQCNLENKTLTLTEGQLDSLSVAEAGVENAVSVPTGAKGFTWISYCWDWVNQFDTIIVFGDYEKGHITLLDEIRQRFSKLKIKHIREADYKDCKDANEILRKYGSAYLRTCIENAELVPSSHIKKLSKVEDVNIYELKKLKTGIYNLDKLLRGGLPFGGVTLIAGKTGEGKSALSSQIIANALEQGRKCFAYSGELPDHLFKAWINYQIAGKNHIITKPIEFGNDMHLISDSNLKLISSWYDENMYIYDDTMVENEFEDLSKTIENSIVQYGCEVILVDNLMTAMDLEQIDGSDKYDRQSKLVKRLVRIAKTYNVVIILVAHKRKNNYGQNDNDEISGSGDITNLGMITLSYEKGTKTELDNGDMTEDQRKLKVVKNRLFGYTETRGWIMEFEPKSRRIYSDNDNPDYEYGWTKQLDDGFDKVENTSFSEDLPWE